jgi:hypothetical protein
MGLGPVKFFQNVENDDDDVAELVAAVDWFGSLLLEVKNRLFGKVRCLIVGWIALCDFPDDNNKVQEGSRLKLEE